MERMFFLPKVDREKITMQSNWTITNAKYGKAMNWMLWKMWDFLEKKGFVENTQSTKTYISMEQFEINLDALDEQIAQQSAVIQHIYNDRIDTLIIGHDIMRKIMHGDPMRAGQIDFQLNRESKYAWRMDGYPDGDPYAEPMRRRIRYNGLNIILVPWFKGFLPIRRDDIR